MKPWTERKQIAAALKNENVRIGTRTLKSGAALRGLYATKAFAVGDYVASFQGRIVDHNEFLKLHDTDRALFESINEYAVLHKATGGHLYPRDLDAPGAHLINHSCGPNASWAQYERDALLVRATKPIAAGEEITIFYGWLGVKAAVENKHHACACEARFCTGTVELNIEMLDHGDGTGGPYVSVKEVASRLLADIMNDVDDHELLLLRYADHPLERTMPGVEQVSFDFAAFVSKMHDGAQIAIETACKACAAGRPVSMHRLKQIAQAYKVTVAAWTTFSEGRS